MLANKIPFSQDELKHLFSYKNGNLYWQNAGGRRRLDVPAGYQDKSGYARIRIDGSRYLVHRIIWAYHTGSQPNNDIDHINRNPLDNRIENLRDVTRSQNLHNMRSKYGGCAGVYFDKRCKRYRVAIYVDYNKTHLGYFSDFFEACCARKSGELKYSPLK